MKDKLELYFVKYDKMSQIMSKIYFSDYKVGKNK